MGLILRQESCSNPFVTSLEHWPLLSLKVNLNNLPNRLAFFLDVLKYFEVVRLLQSNPEKKRMKADDVSTKAKVLNILDCEYYKLSQQRTR